MPRHPPKSKELVRYTPNRSLYKRDQEWEGVEDKLSRGRLVPVLEGSLDPRFQKLLAELACPLEGLATKSIRQLATRHGISAIELADAIRQHKLAMVMLDMSEGIGAVAADAMEDARSREITCSKCEGSGEVGDETSTPCPKCGGEGVVRVVGDIDSRKMVFEATGLIKRDRAGVQLNQNFVAWNKEADESLEALVKETDQVIDGTVIEVKGEDPEEAKDES